MYFSETKEENEFSLLWRSLSQSDEIGYSSIEYISKSSNRTDLLDEFEILFIHQDDEP
jgi:hypothetical protein